MPRPVIEFWFDFSSAYAYFASLEIESLAARRRCEVRWRPFLLGAGAHNDRATGPARAAIREADALRDWKRIARNYGVPFSLPAHHPANSMPAACAFYALEADDASAAAVFAKAVFAGYFGEGLDTADADQVADLAGRLGCERAAMLSAMADPEFRGLVHARSTEALARGILGSPGFIVDGEPFWGWDRMPMIDQWLSEGGW